MEYAVTGIQIDVVPKDREKNVDRAEELISRAASRGAKLVCLPELFTTGFDYDYIKEAAEKIPGPATEGFSRLARKHDMYIVAGSIAEVREGRYYNTACLFSPGGLIARYSKSHLFPLMEEHRFFTPGESIGVVDTEIGKIGILICYDIRFPEAARKLALSGADIIIIPAEFPFPRKEHWDTLLRARAIENQLYIFAVNRVGKDGAGRFFGATSLYDPWGSLIAGSGDEEALVTGRVDTETIRHVREKIPVFDSRREELYIL